MLPLGLGKTKEGAKRQVERKMHEASPSLVLNSEASLLRQTVWLWFSLLSISVSSQCCKKGSGTELELV